MAMLDVTDANQLSIATGMGKSRNERLADHYLDAAGIAAVTIDAATGAIGLQDIASTDTLPGCLIYCCVRGDHSQLAIMLSCSPVMILPDPLRLARQLEACAEHAGI